VLGRNGWVTLRKSNLRGFHRRSGLRQGDEPVAIGVAEAPHQITARLAKQDVVVAPS